MENIEIKETKVETELISEFSQELDSNDLLNYNIYRLEKQAKGQLFTKIIGLFIVILGVYSFFQIPEEGLKTSDIITNCLFIVLGLFFAFAMGPISLALQKRILKKKLTNNYPTVIMNVKVSDEGISFEVLEDEQISEADEPTEKIETESEVESTQEEQMEEPQENIEENNEGIQENAEESNEETENKSQAFTVPWGGILNVEDNKAYLFINIVGYSPMIIKQSACPNLDEIKEYIKNKLVDQKRYIEKTK